MVNRLANDVYYACPSCNKETSVEQFKKSNCCSNCSKFLLAKDRRIKQTGNTPSIDNGKTMDLRVKRLLELRKIIDAKDLVPALVEEASVLIRDDPFAFLLAGVLDRGTKAEIIWTVPYYIKCQLGRLEPSFFAKVSLNELAEVIKRLPRGPRYTRDAPRTIQELSRIIVNEFGGDARKLWDKRSSRAVEGTLRRIYGVGPGIASMIILLIERWYNIEFNDLDHRGTDVKADVHVVRVFGRLGFISELTPQAALIAARRLNPEYPGALDSGTWMVGRNYCKASNPICPECPLNSCCPKIL